MASSESTRVVRNGDIPTGEIDGEILALDIEAGSCFSMDAIGAEIWRIAQQPVSVAEIADRFIQTHEVERTECLRDVLPFIDEMLSAGLLRRAS